MSKTNVMTKAQSDSFGFRYVLSCAAATLAETVTYPLDMIKTRLQIQGEKAIDHRLDAMKKISPATGGRKQGMISVAAKIVYTGIRVLTYETLRDKVFKHRLDRAFPLWEAMCSGVVSGGVAQFFASPTDLVKVQMQMEGRRRLEGLPPRVSNMFQASKLLWSEGGIPGLWKGWVPNCTRAALVNMACKKYLAHLPLN